MKVTRNVLPQYNKRVRAAAEERAQAVPGEGAAAAPQGEVSIAVPRAAGLLRGAVLGEGRHAHRARGARAAQVLAQDLLAEGGESVAFFFSSFCCVVVCSISVKVTYKC